MNSYRLEKKLVIIKDPEDSYEVRRITGKEDNKIENNLVLANELVSAEHRLTELEQKIVVYVMCALRQSDTYFKTYRIFVKDMLKKLNLDPSSGYTKIIDASSGLLSKNVAIKKEKSKLVTTWFSYYEVPNDPGKGWIDVRFSERLAPYLLQLKGAFTMLGNRQLFDMSGRYPIQLYLWLVCERNQPKCRGYVRCNSIEVKELRTVLGLNKNKKLKIDEDVHKDFRNFKRVVLNPALDRINTESDMYVICKEVKTGKCISDLVFYSAKEKGFQNLEDFQNLVEGKKRLEKEKEENSDFLEECEANANL